MSGEKTFETDCTVPVLERTVSCNPSGYPHPSQARRGRGSNGAQEEKSRVGSSPLSDNLCPLGDFSIDSHVIELLTENRAKGRH